MKLFETTLYALQGLALSRDLPIPTGRGTLNELLPMLDELKRDRAVFLLCFLPSREGVASYEASIDGGGLTKGATIRTEGTSPEDPTARALLEYARVCWGFQW